LLANASLLILYALMLWPLFHDTNEYNQFQTYKSKVKELNSRSTTAISIVYGFMIKERENIRFYQFRASPQIFEFKNNIKSIVKLENTLKSKSYTQYTYEVNFEQQIRNMNQLDLVFDSLVKLTLFRGFKDYGLEGKMRDAIHFVEQNKLLPLEQVLMLRRDEKDYLLRHQEIYARRLNMEIDIFTKSSRSQLLTEKLNDYQTYFRQLVHIDSLLEVSPKSIQYQLNKVEERVVFQQRLIEKQIIQYEEENSYNRKRKQYIVSALFILISLGVNLFFAVQISRNLHKLNFSLKSYIQSGYQDSRVWIENINSDEIGDIIFNFQALKREITGLMFNFNRDLEERTRKIEEQKSLLQDQQKHTLESIHYAQYIQKALLPKTEHIRKVFEQSFSIYFPRDIISGDFLWVQNIKTPTKEYAFAIVGDCTGHGVPGAMISMIAITTLNDIIQNKKIYKPERILQKMNQKFIELLQASSNQEIMYEGVDIGILRYEKKKKEMIFSGANRDLLLIRKEEQLVMSGSRMAVGHVTDANYVYKTHQIVAEKGDSWYLFSDGFSDQFGGDQHKKLKRAPFYQLLKQASKMEPLVQSTFLTDWFINWKGSNEQVDDVTIIGIRT